MEIHASTLKRIQSYMQMSTETLAEDIESALWRKSQQELLIGAFGLIVNFISFIYRKLRKSSVHPKVYPKFFRDKEELASYVLDIQKVLCGNETLYSRLDELSSRPEEQIYFLGKWIGEHSDISDFPSSRRVTHFAIAALVLKIGIKDLCAEQ